MFRFFTDRDVKASLRVHTPRLLLGGAAMVGRGLLGLAAPYLFGESINVIFDQGDESLLTRFVVMLLVFAVSTAFCQWWMRWLWIGWSRQTELRMRDRVFAHIISLPLGFFHRSRTGDLMSRLTSDVEAVRMGYGPGVMHCVHPIVMTTGAVILMLSRSPLLTLIAMSPMVVLFFVMKTILPTIHERALKVQERQADLATRAQESFSGARVVQAFAREKHEEARFSSLSRQFLRDSLAHARRRGLFQCSIEVFAGLGNLVLFAAAGLMVVDGTLRPGDYAAFTGYLNLLIWPMIALGWTLALFSRAEAADERIEKIRSEAPEADVPCEGAPTVAHGALSIRGLTFTYPGADAPALVDVSAEVPTGGTLGVVGATASGKSTLVNLLLRLHEPPEGSVFLDGHDVRDLPLADLRSTVGVVPQESFLFSQSIRDNIRFGREDASEEAVAEAVRWSCLDGDLEAFPKGLDTEVGERGVTLSGGQRQRTALARALLRDSRVLVLDDSLSAVDTETEQKILSRLRPVLADRTAIIVSHRLSAVRDADEIIVLDGGRVIERGDHAGLLAQGGHYARLWRLQQEQEELEQL